MKTEFVEIQRFRQWWLWLILLGSFLPLAVSFFRKINREGVSPEDFSFSGWLVYIGINAMVFLFFLALELRTEVDPKGVRMRLRFVDRKVIPWEDVQSAEIITYGFVGYGLRLLTKYGTVFNISGNKGLAIRCKDGSRYLVGTQEPERLRNTLQALTAQHAIPFKDTSDPL